MSASGCSWCGSRDERHAEETCWRNPKFCKHWIGPTVYGGNGGGRGTLTLTVGCGYPIGEDGVCTLGHVTVPEKDKVEEK